MPVPSVRRKANPSLLDLFRGYGAWVLALGWMVALSAEIALAQNEPDRDGERSFAYTLAITVAGASDDALAENLRELSVLHAKAEEAPKSRGQLRRRIRTDAERFEALLRSKGYYGATIDIAVDEMDGADGAAAPDRPIDIRVKVDPGPAFILADYRVALDGPAPDLALQMAGLGLELGAPAEAEAIAKADLRLLRRFGEQGYPFAQVGDRRVVVDHAEKTVGVTVPVTPGPFVHFGPARVSGLDTVSPALVQNKLAWTIGAPFDRRLLERTRTDLMASQLFSAARLAPAGEPDDQGLHPIVITVSERAPRSIGAGASVSTDQGFAAKVFWEHRNFLGGGERFRVSGQFSEVETGFKGRMTVPDFIQRDQALLIDGNITEERTDAFIRETIGAAARLRRPVTDWLSISGGLALERSFVDEDDVQEAFTLVSLPLEAIADTSDDPLNPTRGTRATLSVSPTLQALGSDLSFVTVQLTQTAYLPLDGERRFILAGRYHIGSIAGVGPEELPADRRFFAGGGGSVRGLPFQSIGPRDEIDEVFGGRSVVEVSLELRARLFGDFGAVAFIDGGEVYNDELPDFSTGLRWGAGIGIRYYSPVGPLRFDIAMPLDRRAVIDDPFQIYLSIGQAF